MAYAMVVDYGMSEKVGYVSFNLSKASENPMFEKPYSDVTARVIDEEVRHIIDEVRENIARTFGCAFFIVTAAPQLRRIDAGQPDQNLDVLGQPDARPDPERIAIHDAHDAGLHRAGQDSSASADVRERDAATAASAIESIKMYWRATTLRRYAR